MKNDSTNQTYRLLADIVSQSLNDDVNDESITGLINKINSDPTFIEATEIHGVAPLCYQQLQSHLELLDDNIKRQLQSLTIRHRHAAKIRGLVLSDIVKTLNNSDIPVVILKGAALANMIYDTPGLRPMRDIDILVSKKNQQAVKQILEEVGFDFDKQYASIYMGDMHHLPNATKQVEGFTVSIEIHHEVYSRDIAGSQTFEQIIDDAQIIPLDNGTMGYALDHLCMLKHLCKHSFSLGKEVRLIHQHDIVRYVQTYFKTLPWDEINSNHSFIINTIVCLQCSISLPDNIREITKVPVLPPMSGIGEAMQPYSLILKSNGFLNRCKLLFLPSPWWMHANYNVPPNKSLIPTLIWQHPKRVMADLLNRIYYAIKNTIL